MRRLRFGGIDEDEEVDDIEEGAIGEPLELSRTARAQRSMWLRYQEEQNDKIKIQLNSH